MEMCYDGALMMPSSYAVMNEDEMTYVEGGMAWWQKTAIIIGAAAVAGALTAALVSGQIWAAAWICKCTFAEAVKALGVSGVATVIGVALSVSTATVIGAMALVF